MDKNAYDIIDKLIDSTASIRTVVGGLTEGLRSFPNKMDEKIKGTIQPILENQTKMLKSLNEMKEDLDFKHTVTETLDQANKRNTDNQNKNNTANVEITKSNNDRKKLIWDRAITIIGSILVTLIIQWAVVNKPEPKKANTTREPRK